MNQFDFVTLFFLLVFFVGLGMRKGRKVSNETTYLIADRSTGLLSLTATLVMTELNTSTLLAFCSLGYLAGFRALWLPAVFLIGLLFYAFAVAKKWKEFNGLSVAAFFTQKYGSVCGKMASLALLTAMAGFSATYVKSLYLIFTPLLQFFSPWLGSALLIGLVFAMIGRGGLLSVITTDLWSFVLTLLFFPVLFFFAAKMPAIAENAYVVTEAQVLSWRFILSLILLTMFTYILAPWYGQKIFAASSKKIAFRSVSLAAIIIFFLYGLAVAAAAFLRSSGFQNSSPDQTLALMIQQLLPQGLRGLGYGILFLASATTLTGVWNAMAAMFINDFCSSTLLKDSKRAIFISGGFAMLSYLLANSLVDRIFNQLILANIPIAALAFALLAGFYWKKTSKKGAYLSIAVGWIWGIGSYLFWGEAGEYTWYWAAWGIPCIFLSGILGSLLLPDRQPKRVFENRFPSR